MSQYHVADIMSVKPFSVHPHATMQDAALLMRENSVGSLLVKREDELLGILTEWDFVHKAAAGGLSMSTALVKDHATTDLITVSPAMDLFAALELMRGADVEHLPVMDVQKLVGFITIKDILKIQPQLLDIYLEQNNIRNSF